MTQLTKERVIEVLESLSGRTQDGADRVRTGVLMLATSGANISAIENAVNEASFHAEVIWEAARLLRESSKGLP